MESEIERLKLYNDCLERDIEKLKAKVKRLQKSKLDKFAMAALSSINRLNSSSIDRQETSELIVKQAKSLLAALEKEGCDER